MIQKHRAHPKQAGFFRRFLAFMVDNLIILFISVIVFLSISEIAAARRGEKGEFSQVLSAIKNGKTVVIGMPKAHRPADEKIYFIGGEKLGLFFELIIGYTYYILFFRFGGRTPGKRLFGLRAIDLEGRPQLGWYQSLERTHGYAASALLASLGFFQVLWDRESLTMHDKLAGTTVIRLKS